MEGATPTIMFVDDEKGVLDGLRRSLFAQRDRWDQIFALGGEEAVAIAASRHLDVVVTDMRMPGMDGATVLDRVRGLQPEAARIVLSGFSEREAIFRTVGPAHQYYVKPCSPQTLVDAIERALSVRRTLHAPELLRLVGGVTAIPTLPAVLTRLFEVLQAPEGSAAEAARIIASDVGLTVNLLKLTNSGFFYVPSAVTDVMQAVKMLGFEMVRALAVMAGVFEAFACDGADCRSIERLENRSLQIGAAARAIAEAESSSRAVIEQAQCAGMLSHVGSLLLFSKWPHVMAGLLRTLDQADGGDIVLAERDALGASHADMGGVLLGLWGFTDPVLEAVLYHHEPGRAHPHAASASAPLTAVHAAQHLLRPVPSGQDAEKFRNAGLDMAYLARVGATARVPVWADICAAVRGGTP